MPTIEVDEDRADELISVLRDADGDMEIQEIADKTGTPHRTVRKYLEAYEAIGWVETVDTNVVRLSG